MVETKKRLKNPIVLSAAICAILFYSGLGESAGLLSAQKINFSCAFSADDICALSGKIISVPQKSGNRYYFNLQTFAAEIKSVLSNDFPVTSCSGTVRVYVPSEIVEAFFPGKLYSTAKNRLDGSTFFCESGATVELYGNFRYGNFHAQSGKTTGWCGIFDGRVAHFRALCRLQFRRLLYAWGRAGGLLLSLISGAREYTETETSDGFKNAGLSHILALSGMHLSLVSSIVVIIGIRSFGKQYALFLQAAAVVLFVWFAGASPSLVRALLCSIFLLIAQVCGMPPPDMLYVLCASFLCHAAIRPEDMTSVSFMLSYSALFGIIIIGEKIAIMLSRFSPQKISSALSASIGAQVFTAPISLAIFGAFAPIGIIATAVVSPIVTFFIYAGVIGIFSCLVCPPLVNVTGILLNIIYDTIKIFVLFFSAFPVISLG